MIIVQLTGGLGNQLFQYAAGYALSKQRKTNLKVDLRALKEHPQRFYRLNSIGISVPIATKQEINKVTKSNLKGIRKRLYWAYQNHLPYYRKPCIEEPEMGFDPNFKSYPRDVLLKGYWQSEKYFLSFTKELQEELNASYFPKISCKELLAEIKESESVSIHFRRGDYVEDPTTNNIHGICPVEYYKTSLKLISKNVSHPRYYLFSDDTNWVAKNVHLPFKTKIIGKEKPNKDYMDLYLMKHCKYHIIANSTFSWWGAWLCPYNGKIVIAPKRWFKSNYKNKDILPKEWVRL